MVRNIGGATGVQTEQIATCLRRRQRTGALRVVKARTPHVSALSARMGATVK
jgi:hypothetical protein